MRLKSGPKPRQKLYKAIIALREQKNSITEIGKLLGISKQGVSYYLRKYGDADKKD